MLMHRITTGIVEKLFTVKKQALMVVMGLFYQRALSFYTRATTYGVGGTPAITIVTKTVSATLTAAEVISGLLLANQGAGAAATYTMPTGVLLAAALPKTLQVGDGFEFTIVNISTVAAEDVTVAGGVGTTAVGNMTIASNAAVADQAWGTFYVQKTGKDTFSFYRIG